MARQRAAAVAAAALWLVLALPAAEPGLAATAPAARPAQPARRAAPRRDPGPLAAILMDVRTGQVLYARDANRRLPPASTTKMMTAILAIERFPLDAPVTISARAAAQRSGSAIGVEAGEQWSLDDLLHAMLLRSANDAAVAVAEAYSGSVEAFAEDMNRRAARIGARNTHFVNPHGLNAPDHYSTAYDLALIARYGLRLPVFASLVRQQAWVLDRPDRAPRELLNTNRFLARYEGADGVKTGWTAAAGHCLVASATRDGWQLLAVVLNSRDMYRDVAQLLDYGFETFTPVKLAARGDPLVTVNATRWLNNVVGVVPRDVVAVVRRGAAVSSQVRLRSDLRPPVAPGAPVGEVVFYAGQAVVARSALVAASRQIR
jgi:D-alanyl-D-alanine carboxypeptidase (penicillin-binding protein 5/6)